MMANTVVQSCRTMLKGILWKRDGLALDLAVTAAIAGRRPLQGLVTTRGEKRFLRNVVLRPSRPVQVRVVGKWERRQQEMRQHRTQEADA